MEVGATHLRLSMPTISTVIADDVPSMDFVQVVSMSTISSEITNDVPAMDSVRVVSTPTTFTKMTNDGPEIDFIRVDSSTSKREGKPMSLLEAEIESSKSHWSEPFNDGMDASIQSNKEYYQLLRKKWGSLFFHDPHGRVSSLEKIKKIAEGGQAEIYDVFHKGFDGMYYLPTLQLKTSFFEDPCPHILNMISTSLRDGKAKFVLKVFKNGFSLQDLEKQWPRGMLENLGGFNLIQGYSTQNCCQIMGTTLLENGRFAFVMPKYWGDLRKAIDCRMQYNRYRSPPFTITEVGRIVIKIALGMRELHENNIVHGDLKASNVLVDSLQELWGAFDPISINVKRWMVKVADFECSVGVVGTTYWRAPEILQAVRDRKIEPHLFTKKVDVYSFAMTCYEVMTGMMPFQDLNKDGTQYIKIIEGLRPNLPEDINPILRTLLNKCWHGDPLQRPHFKEITKSLRQIYPSVYVPRKWVRTSRRGMKSCFPSLWLAFIILLACPFLPLAYCLGISIGIFNWYLNPNADTSNPSECNRNQNISLCCVLDRTTIDNSTRQDLPRVSHSRPYENSLDLD